jgi:hypothetical protein
MYKNRCIPVNEIYQKFPNSSTFTQVSSTMGGTREREEGEREGEKYKLFFQSHVRNSLYLVLYMQFWFEQSVPRI